MTKQQRTQDRQISKEAIQTYRYKPFAMDKRLYGMHDKQISKEAMQTYKPSETISHDKKGWYCSELDYRW